ncbi:MAG: tetratricopeptide repeat protein [Chitinophagaceae bacterium]
MISHLRKIFLLFFFSLIGRQAFTQDPAALDSMKTALAKATTPAEKVYWYDNLSRTMMNVSPPAADSMGQELILYAEETRDRVLMIKAYMSNGLRCSYFKGQKNYTKKSIEFYEKALAIARQNRMEKRTGAIQLQLADVYLSIPDKDMSLKYVAEAFSRIATTKDDSLQVESNNIYGKVYLARNEKILALRHYLTALRLAEDIKAENAETKRMKSELLRNCYIYLGSFYINIEDYDKAVDYHSMAYKMLDKLNDKRVPYQRVIDINTIGNLFAAKKNYDIAISYFERSIRMADSLKFATLKMPGYISLLNQYLRMDQPQKAMDYLNSSSGNNLRQYLTNFGMTGIIDQAYAFIFMELNQFDSARVYFLRALPYFEKNLNESSKLGFYMQLGRFYYKTGEMAKAASYYTQVKEIGERNGSLDMVMMAAKHLDSLYDKTGDYKMAGLYGGIYYHYKDSIEKLNKEKELAQVEAADEQQRQERILREQEEVRKRKNNIQYMSIIIGIVVLFIALVVLGMFKVSAGLIKAIGFFVFLMLFEFVFLVFKKNIYSITHGEPWKDLAFMIALAALLVPLHHWLEHRVLKYLTSHNRLTAAGHHIKNRLFRRTREQE